MSIRFAVLGILLAFAAPAPASESVSGPEEAVLDLSRSSRTGGRIAPARPAVPPDDTVSPAPENSVVDADLPVRRGEEVVPRILSRPPPG